VPRLGTVPRPAIPPLDAPGERWGAIAAPGATNSHGTSRSRKRLRQKWGF
jgi:hypothetical protein